MESSHIIQRQILDVAVSGSAAHPERWQAEVQAAAQEALAEVLESVLDQIDDPNALVEIDRLEIDLAPLAATEWKKELPETFRAGLVQQLQQSLQFAAHPEPTQPGTASVKVRGLTELLTHWLQTGLRPWWGQAAGPKTLPVLLREVTLAQPQKLRKALTQAADQEQVVLRLVRQLNGAQLYAWLQDIAPENGPAIQQWQSQEKEALALLKALSRASAPSSGPTSQWPTEWRSLAVRTALPSSPPTWFTNVGQPTNLAHAVALTWSRLMASTPSKALAKEGLSPLILTDEGLSTETTSSVATDEGGFSETRATSLATGEEEAMLEDSALKKEGSSPESISPEAKGEGGDGEKEAFTSRKSKGEQDSPTGSQHAGSDPDKASPSSTEARNPEAAANQRGNSHKEETSIKRAQKDPSPFPEASQSPGQTQSPEETPQQARGSREDSSSKEEKAAPPMPPNLSPAAQEAWALLNQSPGEERPENQEKDLGKRATTQAETPSTQAGSETTAGGTDKPDPLAPSAPASASSDPTTAGTEALSSLETQAGTAHPKGQPNQEKTPADKLLQKAAPKPSREDTAQQAPSLEGEDRRTSPQADHSKPGKATQANEQPLDESGHTPANPTSPENTTPTEDPSTIARPKQAQKPPTQASEGATQASNPKTKEQPPSSSNKDIAEGEKSSPTSQKPTRPSLRDNRHSSIVNRNSPPSYLTSGSHYIHNAGLVLLWPYLSHFYKGLGLMTPESTWASTEAQNRAVYLLQAVLQWEEAPLQEPDLLLNKILTGWPLEEPLYAAPDFTAEEREATRELLQAVLTVWDKGSGTSPEGFAGTFLLREGRLEMTKNQDWQLTVASKTLDLILHSIPWPRSLVKLSWMDTVIHVQW